MQSPSLPALMHGVKIGKKAHEINFDWSSAQEVMEKVREELEELNEEIESKEASKDRMEDELGDLLFSIAQLSRHLGIDPEIAAAKGNQKFLTRFSKVEGIARDRKLEIEKLPQKRLEELWRRRKKTRIRSGFFKNYFALAFFIAAARRATRREALFWCKIPFVAALLSRD